MKKESRPEHTIRRMKFIHPFLPRNLVAAAVSAPHLKISADSPHNYLIRRLTAANGALFKKISLRYKDLRSIVVWVVVSRWVLQIGTEPNIFPSRSFPCMLIAGRNLVARSKYENSTYQSENTRYLLEL